MGQLIKSFVDGSYLEYDRGSFDDWCVYLTKSSGAVDLQGMWIISIN